VQSCRGTQLRRSRNARVRQWAIAPQPQRTCAAMGNCTAAATHVCRNGQLHRSRNARVSQWVIAPQSQRMRAAARNDDEQQMKASAVRFYFTIEESISFTLYLAYISR